MGPVGTYETYYRMLRVRIKDGEKGARGEIKEEQVWEDRKGDKRNQLHISKVSQYTCLT